MTHPSIEAIIFDLGRVLISIDSTLLVEKLFKGFDKNDPQFVQRTMHNEHMIEFNTGRIGPETFHQYMCSDFGLDMDYNTFVPLWCSIFYTMDGMEELVLQLQGHVKLGLLSDTDPVHWPYVKKKWPWLNVFKKPTLSFEIGLMKPDPHIFLIAAQNVDTPPEKCLYIDDLQANVEGARAVGMTAVQFKSVRQLQKLLQDKCIIRKT